MFASARPFCDAEQCEVQWSLRGSGSYLDASREGRAAVRDDSVTEVSASAPRTLCVDRSGVASLRVAPPSVVHPTPLEIEYVRDNGSHIVRVPVPHDAVLDKPLNLIDATHDGTDFWVLFGDTGTSPSVRRFGLLRIDGATGMPLDFDSPMLDSQGSTASQPFQNIASTLITGADRSFLRVSYRVAYPQSVSENLLALFELRSGVAVRVVSGVPEGESCYTPVATSTGLACVIRTGQDLVVEYRDNRFQPLRTEPIDEVRGRVIGGATRRP